MLADGNAPATSVLVSVFGFVSGILDLFWFLVASCLLLQPHSTCSPPIYSCGVITPPRAPALGLPGKPHERPHRMSRPQSRVGFGRGREGSGSARHNILANVSRVGQKKIGVKVIRHRKSESFPQAAANGGGLLVSSSPRRARGHTRKRSAVHLGLVLAVGMLMARRC
jgi:hypothetical protein